MLHSPPASPAAPARRRSRRAVLTAAAGSVLALAGCGGGSAPAGSDPSAYRGTPVVPVPVPGQRNRWAGRTVRVAAFGGQVEAALRSLVWEPFSARTGCRVESVVRTPPIGAGGTPPAGGPPRADLLLADPITAAGALDDYAPLPAGLVAANASGRLGDGAATAPAFAYALVIAQRRGAFAAGAAPATWADWWDVARFPGNRALGRSPVGTLEAALLADGVAPAALYPLDVARALAALDRVAASIGDRWWTQGIEPVGWLGTDRAELASAWHHRVIAGQWDGLAVDLAWDGGVVVVDQWAVPRGAAEPEIAVDLLRYTLDPAVQAAVARETRLGPMVPAAFERIEPWLLPTIPTAPPQVDGLVPLDPGWWAESGPAARDAFEEWFTALTG